MTPPQLLDSLRIPLMQAPMSVASGVDLVAAASRAGVMGCFPTHNARLDGGLATWLERIRAAVGDAPVAAPHAVNINVSSRRDPDVVAEDLRTCRDFAVPVITTNAGDPTRVVETVHDWGGLVIHDAVDLAQARRAIAAGVDGLMLVCAGAGGLGGLASPFALLPRVRAEFDDLIVLAGGIADGRGIAAARLLGADMVCMGTRFIATAESAAPDGHKRMIAEHGIADLKWTNAICGIDANFLEPSIRANGLDPEALAPPAGPGRPVLPDGVRAWSTVWSAGHSLELIADVPSVADLVDRLEDEYRTACREPFVKRRRDQAARRGV